MEITKKLIKFNFTANANNPEYIVIHDTGNPNKGANAEMHYQYFNGGDRQASAHFFVDDFKVLQVIEIKDKSWSCGDGANKYGINNGNSIGIELCINSDINKDIAMNNLLELTKLLMAQYNIPAEKVVRHYDASRKICPASMSANDWTKWKDFKASLKPAELNRMDSINILVKNGIIKDPSYWIAYAMVGQKCEGAYVEILIKNIAKLLK
jgi:N-acetylmuramoyl-L-alanine amidase